MLRPTAVTMSVFVVVGLAAGQERSIPAEATPADSCAQIESRGAEFQPLAKACRYALASPRTLPDFVCTEIVQRFFSPKEKPETVAAQLTVEKMRSHYENVTVNGKLFQSRRTGDDVFEEKAGSTGEFAMLFNIFDPASKAAFQPPVDAAIGSKRCKRYDYRVQRKNNVNWTWFFTGTAINPGYHGSIFVDGRTGEVLRLIVQVSADEIDADTPVSEATTTVNYGDVEIGAAGMQHVPLSGENVSCFRFMTGCIRATLTFRNFHKFGADTRIVPATP